MSETIKEVEYAFVQASEVLNEVTQDIECSVDLIQLSDDHNVADWCRRASETVHYKMNKFIQVQLMIDTLLAILVKEGHPRIWDEGDEIKCICADSNKRLKLNKTYTVEELFEVDDEVTFVKVMGIAARLPVRDFVLVTNPGFDLDL